MAWITLRQFAWTERPGRVDPYPEVDDIHRVAVDRLLPVDLSYAVSVNALAVPASGPVRYETRQHELRLVLCYLNSDPDGPIRLRDEPFRASASHIRRFVSESIGLGMLTAAVQAAYQSQTTAIAHVDALPTALAGQYNPAKTRPDLLFDLPGQILAGEARGRFETPPTRASTQQRDRLNSLIPWSRHHGTHPLAMTWAYTTGLGATVDLFTRSGRLPGMTGPVGQAVSAPVAIQPELFDEDQLTAPARPGADHRPRRDVRARDFDRSSPRELATAISRRVGDIADQLYQSAPRPDPPIRVGEQDVRGSWAALDLLGPSTGSFVLGVLNRPLSRERGLEVTARLRQRDPESNGLSILVSGRMVVAISTDTAGQPWRLIAD
ncbi:hypothetical protein [Actinocrispum wychmicini]|uniref:hypothetical protein n=1 Tax=Actinocrispum wychmicini TaxID=1213861 RepID=UPI001051E12F|nr:hypothetical protein [Actinocrispum wychmicini]